MADYLTAPRDQGCMSAAINGGIATGAASGAVGGLAGSGSVTGPGELVIEPTAVIGGAAVSGASGLAAGMSACKTGAGSSGEGGGSNAKSARKLSNSEADAAARKGGYAGAEDLKKDFVGPNSGAHYDLNKQPNGDIEIFRKGGVGEGIETGINIKM